MTDSGGSGIDHVSFPSLGGMTGGGDDTTSPYQAGYDWDSGSSASGAQTVTVHNNAGLTSSTTFTVTPDGAPPTGQSAAVTAGYFTSLSVPVSLQNGSDALSGIDPATAVLERETATLANGSCVAWSRHLERGQPRRRRGHHGAVEPLLPLPLLDLGQRRQPVRPSPPRAPTPRSTRRCL